MASSTHHPRSSVSSYVPRMKDGDYLKSYMRDAAKFPMISADEEIELAKDWHAKGDSKAMKQLLESHLRLVIRIARGYKGYGMSTTDLIAEGNIGLMQALRRFDPEKGYRFSTYAMWWIKAAMKDFVMKNWSMVKIGTTSAQKKLFFGLRNLQNKVLSEEEKAQLSDDHIKSISSTMDVSEKEVREMSQRLNQDYSLNASIKTGEDAEWQDWLSDEVDNHEVTIAHQQELEKRRVLLQEALRVLPDREKEVLFERRLTEPPKTLDEIGKSMNLSKERIRQIEVGGFKLLQKEMQKRAEQLKL